MTGVKALLALGAFLTDISLARPVVDALASSNSAPTANIKNGTVVGSSNLALKAEAFLGIPYANAPRFGNPTALNTTFDGSFDATSYGNVCPGYGVSSYPNITAGQDYTVSEDCLNINIIRPAGTTESDRLPVLLWIFGGGLVQGTANDPRYNGTYLVKRSVEIGKPIIFASINYRVAAFGFPAGQAAAGAGVLNLGFKDQRKSLEWLQENVASFGGDKDKVTIWGQSAGGQSVVAQLTAYGGVENPPFRAAISNSGVFATSNASLASQAPAWSRFLNATSCSDNLACLRALPFDTIYAAANGTFNPAAVPDDDFLPAPSWKLFKEKKFSRVPLILGHNLDEATSGIGAPVGINNDTQFEQVYTRAYATQNPSNATLDRFPEIFPNDNSRGCPFGTGDGVLPTGLQDKRVNWLYTDGLAAGVRYLSKQFSSVAPAYKYHFVQVPQNSTIDAGVAHFFEIPYIFGVMEQTVRSPMSQRPGDLETSRIMQEYWINFVHDTTPAAKGGPEWEKYSEGQQVLTIRNYDTKLSSDDYRQESIQFLSDIASNY